MTFYGITYIQFSILLHSLKLTILRSILLSSFLVSKCIW